MVKKMMYGVEGVAKAIPKAYWGVDGVARKIKKAYYGVGGVAKEIFALKEGFLYNGTSTFIHTPGSLDDDYEGYTLEEDTFTLKVTTYDSEPLNVYMDGDLIQTYAEAGEHTLTMNDECTHLLQAGSITISIQCASEYGLGSQKFGRIWSKTVNKSTSRVTPFGYITSATISDNVIGLLTDAMRCLSGPIDIPQRGLKTIGASAFYQVKTLTELNIPLTVTEIGNSAFGYSGLTRVSIPDCIEEIPYYAFSDTPLSSVDIPRSVKVIGTSAFGGCRSLSEITFRHTANDVIDIFTNESSPSLNSFGNGGNTDTLVRHNGCPSVLDYNWAACNRNVTYVQM